VTYRVPMLVLAAAGLFFPAIVIVGALILLAVLLPMA
jgi:hypothetical protein